MATCLIPFAYVQVYVLAHRTALACKRKDKEQFANACRTIFQKMRKTRNPADLWVRMPTFRRHLVNPLIEGFVTVDERTQV